MLAQRLTTAAIGIPLILAVVLLGGVVYALVAAAILVLAALEFVAMVDLTESGEPPKRAWRPGASEIAVVAGIVLVVIGADTGMDEWTGAIVAALGLVFIACTASQSRGLQDWLPAVGALMYIGVLGSYLVILRDIPDGADWILLAVVATWGTDTFAYFTGKAIGRHKMAPRISPGKTWEGTAGALVGGLLTIIVLDLLLTLPMSTGDAVLLGLILPAVSVAADLGESMLKRGAGVKDTSELIPGHGGFLDRLDSILFTVPLVYYFVIWVVV